MSTLRRRGGANSGPAVTETRSETISKHLKKYDVFEKVERNYRIQTEHGGLLSVITYIFMVVLFMGEFLAYWPVRVSEHIKVDSTAGGRLRININITFPALPCSQVSLVAMDVAGEHQLGIDQTIHKHRRDASGNPIGARIKTQLAEIIKHGDDHTGGDDAKRQAAEALANEENYCGSCYGAGTPLPDGTPQCCNTCDEVRSVYEAKGWDVSGIVEEAEQCKREKHDPASSSKYGEGCNLEGYLGVNKVAGNFHIALGRSKSINGRLIHQFKPSDLDKFNTTHTIHTISFGVPFPGQSNPLDGMVKVIDSHLSKTGVFQYFVKIVPTNYTDRRGYVTSSNQYTYTEKFVPIGEGSDAEKAKGLEAQHGNGHRHPAIIKALPGVFVVYNLSPFIVHRTEEVQSFFHFLVRVSAIVGGVFTVSGLVDKLVTIFQQSLSGKRAKTIGIGL